MTYLKKFISAGSFAFAMILSVVSVANAQLVAPTAEQTTGAINAVTAQFSTFVPYFLGLLGLFFALSFVKWIFGILTKKI